MDSTLTFLKDNIWLILLAIASGIGLLWPMIAKRISGIPQIGVAEAVQLINRRDAMVLDVRSPGEFGNGHLTSARNIPEKELKTRAGEIDKWKDKPVIVHCATGNRSQSAAEILKGLGFKEVFNLHGGINAWSQAGMPVEKK